MKFRTATLDALGHLGRFIELLFEEARGGSACLQLGLQFVCNFHHMCVGIDTASDLCRRRNCGHKQRG
jgi:hypothetical protein